MKAIVKIIEELMFFYTIYVSWCASISVAVGVVLISFWFTYIGLCSTGIPVDKWATIMNDEESRKNLDYVMWTLTPYKMTTWFVIIWAIG